LTEGWKGVPVTLTPVQSVHGTAKHGDWAVAMLYSLRPRVNGQTVRSPASTYSNRETLRWITVRNPWWKYSREHPDTGSAQRAFLDLDRVDLDEVDLDQVDLDRSAPTRIRRRSQSDGLAEPARHGVGDASQWLRR
jgi:hypothetical protein